MTRQTAARSGVFGEATGHPPCRKRSADIGATGTRSERRSVSYARRHTSRGGSFPAAPTGGYLRRLSSVLRDVSLAGSAAASPGATCVHQLVPPCGRRISGRCGRHAVGGLGAERFGAAAGTGLS
ncbi:MAG: hypothetical protein JWO75_499 [Actinomycetia bacterium]|nr:hypothetical protein [Actinomycetes bacterium]